MGSNNCNVFCYSCDAAAGLKTVKRVCTNFSLKEIAIRCKYESVCLEAVRKMTIESFILDVAKSTKYESVCLEAARKTTIQSSILEAKENLMPENPRVTASKEYKSYTIKTKEILDNLGVKAPKENKGYTIPQQSYGERIPDTCVIRVPSNSGFFNYSAQTPERWSCEEHTEQLIKALEGGLCL